MGVGHYVHQVVQLRQRFNHCGDRRFRKPLNAVGRVDLRHELALIRALGRFHVERQQLPEAAEHAGRDPRARPAHRRQHARARRHPAERADVRRGLQGARPRAGAGHPFRFVQPVVCNGAGAHRHRGIGFDRHSAGHRLLVDRLPAGGGRPFRRHARPEPQPDHCPELPPLHRQGRGATGADLAPRHGPLALGRPRQPPLPAGVFRRPGAQLEGARLLAVLHEHGRKRWLQLLEPRHRRGRPGRRRRLRVERALGPDVGVESSAPLPRQGRRQRPVLHERRVRARFPVGPAQRLLRADPEGLAGA
mmetsp:Transcript_97403/g.297596  ORF Transcript_97403/g.297596 Transcript_97403/m.297596 type:complete len:305 (+) Transcript_97403:599-1513(+)